MGGDVGRLLQTHCTFRSRPDVEKKEKTHTEILLDERASVSASLRGMPRFR